MIHGRNYQVSLVNLTHHNYRPSCIGLIEVWSIIFGYNKHMPTLGQGRILCYGDLWEMTNIENPFGRSSIGGASEFNMALSLLGGGTKPKEPSALRKLFHANLKENMVT